ncbi:collagen alpha-2(I) chain-like [Drosophila subpulchrella]|uniref:collagen alpha-2(I) chain-like n=1 Tax=Drosophila subpulchrella TaxID=1486046 RepID=UPI0018A17E6B|nr:collagen alpha-2(I) chain-like [Drosophila subpulchrella]
MDVEARQEERNSRGATRRRSAEPPRRIGRGSGTESRRMRSSSGRRRRRCGGSQDAPGPRGGGGAMACPSAGSGTGRATVVGGTGGGRVGGPTQKPSPGRKGEDEDEPCVPSPPQWLSEVPPTPRYEGEWFTSEDWNGDGGAPVATTPWRPPRPPRPGIPPGAGGGNDGGADRGTGSPREPQHAGICGQGRAVAVANCGVDVAGGTRDGDSEGGAQDMGRRGPQGEPSGSPDERPTGCVGPADANYRPTNTGDYDPDGVSGCTGEGTLGVA